MSDVKGDEGRSCVSSKPSHKFAMFSRISSQFVQIVRERSPPFAISPVASSSVSSPRLFPSLRIRGEGSQQRIELDTALLNTQCDLFETRRIKHKGPRVWLVNYWGGPDLSANHVVPLNNSMRTEDAKVREVCHVGGKNHSACWFPRRSQHRESISRASVGAWYKHKHKPLRKSGSGDDSFFLVFLNRIDVFITDKIIKSLIACKYNTVFSSEGSVNSSGYFFSLLVWYFLLKDVSYISKTNL